MSESNVIRQIEHSLQITLEKVGQAEALGWGAKGYVLNDQGQVQALALNGCNIKQLTPIEALLAALPGLTELQLSDNKISDVQPLGALSALTRLDLSDNKISDVQPLGALSALTWLDLSGNRISDLTALSKNTSLTASLTTSLTTSLTALFLDGNPIKNIQPLATLPDLTTLDLSRCELSDIAPLSQLHRLKTLWLHNNQITDITPLRHLFQSGQLARLSLQHNPITTLPSWLGDFAMEFKWQERGYKDGFITLFANPLTTPPVEIVRQGKAAFRSYFAQLAQQPKGQPEEHLFEAKMLILGEPGAGKTSLAWKIEDPNCDLPADQDTTRGIDVRQHYFALQADDFPGFKHPETLANKHFRVNLWDFGGQEIYKATHRFFLSNRSLYALVSDSRSEDTDFNYWLHTVELFGGDSPLLIILNEKHQRERQLDLTALRQRFANIVEVLTVDLADGDDLTRLQQIRQAVKYYIARLPHIGSPVPGPWTIVREKLETYSRHAISLQDYLALCADCGIEQPQDALTLSRYFHDIGVFLHFQADPLLNKTLFLKPNWATAAVYQVLDDPRLGQRNGRFNRADAGQIWADSEFDLLRDELLRLMEKFNLVFEMRRGEQRAGQYIAPERLPAAQPDYHWDKTDNLLLRYQYRVFMPKGILSHLMVLLHHYIHDHHQVWKRGMVLERDNARAEVIETYDTKTIKISIAGQQRRDLMIVISDALDQINGQYDKMQVDKCIPCQCGQCRGSEKPHFYDYDNLKRRIDKGQRQVECDKSYDRVDVQALLEQVMEKPSISRETRHAVPEFRPELMSKLMPEPRPTGQARDPRGSVLRDKVFVSYSHKDKAMLARVQTHLSVLKNEGIETKLWDDSQIKAGDKWRDEIKQALASAKVAILLMSTDFLASEFIKNNELPHLLQAAEKDGATILPLLLKPCRFDKHQQLREFQSINTPDRALSKLSEDEQEEELLKLMDRIDGLIK